ncbi:hypothetical protein EV368DRAFT_51127 [Lentinula lateritia]|nr:hypothetical protein EV368DRAFT_51127 [Lentinula lateritia]
MHIPPPPVTQALSSETFRPPPLDGSLTLCEMYDWHARNTSNHRLFVFAQEDGTTRTIFWPEAVKAVWTGVRLIRDRVSSESLEKTPIVAIVSMSDTISYFITMMSIIRANFIVFPISPRNSPQAVAHLISKVGVDHILMGHESSMQDLVREALEIVKTSSAMNYVPHVSLAPFFEDLFLQNPVSNADDLPFKRRNPHDILFYIHSSGSTAHPKPIPWTNHRFLELSLIPWFGEQDLCDKILSLHVMPMYHGMGILQICWTASTGVVIAAFKPQSPAVLPTPENLFEAATAARSDILFCVPAFIEAWSKVPRYVDWLATRTGVLFGGGPLNKRAGDLLSSKGVSIFVLYGSTEMGIVSSLIPASPISDWEYFPLSGVVTAHMMPHGENKFELIMVSNEFSKPSVVNTKIDGIDAYATSDLLLPHPTVSGYWRIFGRVDDQIIHNTGEKTNPVPLENTLSQDPYVAAAVMFGRGRFQAGVLVEPKPPYRFEPSNERKLSEFRNKIWPTIEQMNGFAPQHSRVFKEMILVASPFKPFTYTAKNTARRQLILDQYEEEIEAVYKAVEETTQSDIPAPVEWNLLSTKSFVRNIVTQVLSHTVKDGDDIFQYGCDSLQATWIRNTIHRALRESAEIDIRQSTSNFVYDHPTINQLARHVLSVALGEEGTGNTVQENKVKLMEQMVEKYIADFPAAPSEVKQLSHHDQKVVLLTGSTGALGSHILDELVKYKGVKKIYALNRKGIDGLADRQRMALKERGLNEPVEDIECRRVVLLEGNTSVSNFGLEAEIFNEMTISVTHIIHNAWRVDFNPGLSSFESHIKGLRRIVDFCITSQASLFFTSSIGVLTGIVAPPPEAPIPPAFALSNGYTQSKWVSEQILDAAHRNNGLKYLNIRIGQLTGAINGAWNVKEWFPSMIQASKILGCIPSDHRNISWIPVYHAAATIVDFVNNGSIHDNQHVHLIHPCPVPWSSLVSVFANTLGLDVVEYRDWFNKLMEKGDTKEMYLVPFFQKIGQEEVAKNREAFEMPKVQLKLALAASETLRERSREIQEEDVERWLAYWKNV